MAYSFNGRDQSISFDPPLTAIPITMHANALPNDINNAGSLCVVKSNGYFSLYYRGDMSDDPFVCDFRIGGNAKIASKPSTLNVWQSVAGSAASYSINTIYVNASKAINQLTISALDSFSSALIGAYSTTSERFSGLLSDCAIWNAALTDAEIASLAKGFKPTRIRPQSLVFYAPLLRNLQDIKGGLALINNNGATVADHPRVY